LKKVSARGGRELSLGEEKESERKREAGERLVDSVGERLVDSVGDSWESLLLPTRRRRALVLPMNESMVWPVREPEGLALGETAGSEGSERGSNSSIHEG
jgi:hypothetical protein